MPYNPGITDISGQLLGRGMESAAQARAQGIGAISNAFTDTFRSIQQNKFLNDQNLAKFQGAANANPEMLQFLNSAGNTDDPNAPKLDPKILKAFSNIRDGKADVYDTSLLASFSESFNKGKEEQQKRALMAQQVEDVKAQAVMRGQQAAQLKDQMDLAKRFMSEDQQAGATTSAATGPQTYASDLSNRVPSFGNVNVPSQTALSQNAPANVPEGVPAMLARPGTTAPRAPQGDAVVNFDPRMVAREMFAETGYTKMPTGSAVTSRVKEKQAQARKERAEGLLFNTQEEALADARKKIDAGELPSGTTLVTKSDPSTRKWYNESAVGQELPKVAAERKRLETQAELSAKADADYLSQIRKNGAGATESRFENEEIRKLLKEKIPSGPLEPYKAQVRKVSANLGLADDAEIDAANKFDKLDSLLMRNQVKTAQEATRGNLNTYEQQLIRRAVASAESKLAGSNEYLNDVVDSIKAKQEDHFKEERRLRKTIKDTGDLADKLRDWELDPNNSINSYFQKIHGAQSSSPSAISTSTGAAPASDVGVPVIIDGFVVTRKS